MNVVRLSALRIDRLYPTEIFLILIPVRAEPRSIVQHEGLKVKVKQLITGLDRPRGFQEVEAPRLEDNRQPEGLRQ